MEKWRSQVEVAEADEPRSLLKKVFKKKDLLHVKFRYFKGGVLCIDVDSSVRLYELNLRKQALLDKLRAATKTAIKDLRFCLGDTQ